MATFNPQRTTSWFQNSIRVIIIAFYARNSREFKFVIFKIKNWLFFIHIGAWIAQRSTLRCGCKITKYSQPVRDGLETRRQAFLQPTTPVSRGQHPHPLPHLYHPPPHPTKTSCGNVYFFIETLITLSLLQPPARRISKAFSFENVG